VKFESNSRWVFLALFLFLFPLPAFSAQQKIPEIEQRLLDSVNRERASRQLPLVKWDEILARAARKHAELMADEDQLLHQLPGESDLPTRIRAIGGRYDHVTENIARGEDASGFHDGWMHSPGHRANILDPQVDSVGISVFDSGETVFAVQDFGHSLPALSFEEQRRLVQNMLTLRGLQPLNVGNAAEESCKLERGFVGGSKPRFIAHYETPDISALPGDLVKELHSRPYNAAAVGACPPSPGAPRFRLVVMLY
jgi:uncharacterized protein YkwD